MSDFGNGFIVNIVKAMEHFFTTEYKEINKIYHKYNEDAIRDITSKEKGEILTNITNWVYGIYDHIGSIKIPCYNEHENIKWEKIRSRIEDIKRNCISIKEVYMSPLYDVNIWFLIDEARSMYDIMKDMIILIDKNLGIDSDWGEW